MINVYQFKVSFRIELNNFTWLIQLYKITTNNTMHKVINL